MKPITNASVARVFAAYPSPIRKKLMALRELILQTAATTPGVGALEETLKWGEPAYLTAASKSGSAVRIAWKKSKPAQYAMYLNCQTTLINDFKFQFSAEFTYQVNRAIVFEHTDDVAIQPLRHCVAAALTYHQAKKKRRPSGQMVGAFRDDTAPGSGSKTTRQTSHS